MNLLLRKINYKTKKIAILVLLCLIVLFGAFLRFYDLLGQLHFAGDEGRDMIIVQEIVQGEEFPTLGPPASTGGFLLGPAYYYLMAVPVLFSPHPAAPAFMVAIFGVLTILLLYFTGRKIASKNVGLIAATLYTFSFLTIIHDRWSWNPNLLPFFVTLIILCVYNIRQQQSPKARCWQAGGAYVILLGIALGISLQLHATAWLLLPVLLIFWLIFPPRVKKITSWIIGMVALIVTLLPWIAYEFTHNFVNTRGVFEILKEGEARNLGERISYVWQSFLEINNELWFGGLLPLWLVAISIIVVSGALIWRLLVAKSKLNEATWFMVILGFAAILFYIVYSGELWPHYWLLLFPVSFLGVALAATGGWWKIKWARLVIIALVIFMSYSGVYAYLTHFWALESGTAVGSYGVPLQDEQAVVQEIVQKDLDQIDLQIVTKDNFNEAFTYLLSQKEIDVTAEAPFQAIIYRLCEDLDLEALIIDYEVVQRQQVGNLGFVIIRK
ncbi:ArnT family glycosyltransferase [Patescibacteria group bacterium]